MFLGSKLTRFEIYHYFVMNPVFLFSGIIGLKARLQCIADFEYDITNLGTNT